MISMLRTALPAFTALALAACAGGPLTPANPAPVAGAGAATGPVDALPPQTLAPGACGLFLFELREPNTFVLFENEAERRVRLLVDGAVLELDVARQDTATAPGETLRRVYLDPRRNMTYTLTGRLGAEIVSGQRLERVILRARTLDGQETVTPLGGVRRCVARSPVRAPSR